MAIYALLDDWDNDRRDQAITPDTDSVGRLLRELIGRECADVFLLKDGQNVAEAKDWLAVTSSLGRYSVLATVERKPLYLIGDEGAIGEVPFAHGGVLSSWPLRFCVDVEDAMAVALQFVESDGELAAPTRWRSDPREDSPSN